MIVVHVLNELKFSGAERMLEIAGEYFSDKGIIGHVVAFGSETGEFAEELRKVGYQIHQIKFGRNSLASSIKFFRLLKLIKPDVVHVHAERGSFRNALVVRMAGVPRIVRTYHNIFSFSMITRFRIGLERFLERLLGQINVSISLLVRINEKKQFLNNSIVIGNWINLDHFNPATASLKNERRERIGVPPERKVIVTVGSCSNQKQHRLLFQALNLMEKEKRPFLVHVGIGPNEKDEREMINTLELSNDVLFLGALKDVLPALQSADVMVMPSEFEGMPLAVYEGLAVGLQLVLSNIPPFRELEKLKNVHIVEKQDARMLADMIEKIIECPAVTQDKEIKTTIEKLSPKSQVGKYISLYEMGCR